MFGEVVDGARTVKNMELLGSSSGKPKKTVKIMLFIYSLVSSLLFPFVGFLFLCCVVHIPFAVVDDYDVICWCFRVFSAA